MIDALTFSLFNFFFSQNNDKQCHIALLRSTLCYNAPKSMQTKDNCAVCERTCKKYWVNGENMSTATPTVAKSNNNNCNW